MTIQEILANHIAKVRANQEKWEATVNDFPFFYEELARLGIEPRFSEIDSSLDILFHGDGETFQRVWRMLRGIGFRPNNRPSEDKKSEFATFWHHPDQRYSRIWFHYTSSVCKAVKVGTRMVEEAVYAVTCGDGQTTLGSLLASENDNALARE